MRYVMHFRFCVFHVFFYIIQGIGPIQRWAYVSSSSPDGGTSRSGQDREVTASGANLPFSTASCCICSSLVVHEYCVQNKGYLTHMGVARYKK